MDRFMKLFRRGDSDIQTKDTAAAAAIGCCSSNGNCEEEENITAEQSAVICDEDTSKVSKRREQTGELEGQHLFSEGKVQAVKRLARRTKQLLYNNFMSYQESQEKDQEEGEEEVSPTSDVRSQQLPCFKELAIAQEHNSNENLKHGSFDAGHKAVNVVLVNYQEDKYSVQWLQHVNSQILLQDTIYKLKEIKKNDYQLYVKFLEDQFLQKIQAGEDDDEEHKNVEENHRETEIDQKKSRQTAIAAENFLTGIVREVFQNGKTKSTEKAGSLNQQSQQSQEHQSLQLKPSSLEASLGLSQKDYSQSSILEKETILDENSQAKSLEDLPTKKRFQNAEEYVVLKVNGQQQQQQHIGNDLLEGKAMCSQDKDNEMEDEDGDKFYSTEQGLLEEVVLENQERDSAVKAVQNAGQSGSDILKDSHMEKEINGVNDKNEEGLAVKLLVSEKSQEETKHGRIEVEEEQEEQDFQKHEVNQKDKNIQEEVQENAEGKGNVRSFQSEDGERMNSLQGEVEEEQIRQEELTQERLKRQAKMTFYLDNQDNADEEEDEEVAEEDKNAGAGRRLHSLKDRNGTLSQNQRASSSSSQPSGHASLADSVQQQSTNQTQIRSKNLQLDSVTSQQDNFNPISHHRKHSCLREEKTHEGENESYITNEVKYTLRAEEGSPKNDRNAGGNEANHESKGDQKDCRDSEVEKAMVIEVEEKKEKQFDKNNKEERNINKGMPGGLKAQEEKGELQEKGKRNKRIEEREEGEEEEEEEEEDIDDEEDKDQDSQDESEKIQTNEEEEESEGEENEEQEEEDDDTYESKLEKKKILDQKDQLVTSKSKNNPSTTTTRNPTTITSSLSKDQLVGPTKKTLLKSPSKPTPQQNLQPAGRPKIIAPDKLTTIKSFSKSLANSRESQSHSNNNNSDSIQSDEDEEFKGIIQSKKMSVARISRSVQVPFSQLSNFLGRTVLSARKSAPITCNRRFSRRDDDEDEDEEEEQEEEEDGSEEEDNDQEESEENDNDGDENKFDEEDQSGDDF